MKFLMSLVVFGILLMSIGCGSATEANSNMTAANTNISNARIQNVDPSNLPPGLSASPIAPVGNSVPGIPSSANAVNSTQKGSTPAPGTDPSLSGRPVKPGATPTPGIPDPATLKKQMEEIRKRLNSNSNQPQPPPPPPPGAGDGQMMRKKPRMSNSNN